MKVLRNAFILQIICFLLLTACKGGGNETVDEFTGNTVGSDFGNFGNSSISFTPVPWDFGTLIVGNVSSTKTITATNISSKQLFLSSVGVSSSHFQWISDDCPRYPVGFGRNASCDIIVRFTPTSVGSLAASLNIKFGDQATNITSYTSSGSLIGAAVTPLSFTGLDSICGKTHNTMTLCWTADASATIYQIFDVSSGSLVWVKNVDNSSGTVNTTIVTALTPSTAYTFRVRAIDGTGQSELNTTDRADTTLANNPPVLSDITNMNVYGGTTVATINQFDTNTAGDTDIDGDTITYTCFYDTTPDGFLDAVPTACSALSNEGGGNPTFNTSQGTLSGWVPLHADAGLVQYEIFITGTDPYSASAVDFFTATVLAGVPLLTNVTDYIFPSAHIDQLANVTFDVNNTRSGTPGNDTDMSYTCVFDRVVDGAVAAGTNCTALPGTISFGAGTGIFNWTPSVAAFGAYEIKITGTNTPGSSTEIVVIDVRNLFSTTALLAHWDPQFATSTGGQATNAPFTGSIEDLFNSGTNSDGVLSNFAQTTSSGWSGDGSQSITTAANGPYRLVFDGVNDEVNFGATLNSQTAFFFDLWLRPTNLNQPNKFILTNGDGANGLSLSTTAEGDGRLELVIGENSYASEVLADNPSGYWRLGEPYGLKAMDISGNAINGAYSANGVTYSQSGAMTGDSDTAVSLNGTNGSMSAPYGVGTTVTIEVWARATGYTTNMMWRTGPNGAGPDLFFTSGVIALNTWDGAANPFCTIPADALNGIFHHYVAVIDGVGSTATLYYDGNICGTATYRNPTAASITFSSGLGTYEWNGSIDEAAVYNYALSPTRISAHYNAKTRSVCRSSTGLIANYWNHVAGFFDGVSTTTLYMNNTQACTFALANTYNGSANDLLLGTNASAKAWSGSLGALRLYTSGNAATVSTNFNATKDIYGENLSLAGLGLKMWLKTDSLFGYSDGDPVCFWRDQSGNNNHLIAPAQSNCPIYYSNIIGPIGDKKPILQFNGTSHRLNFSTAMTDVRTVIIVHKWNGLSGDYRALLGHASVYHWITGAGADVGTDKMASSVYSSPNLLAGNAYLNRGAAQAPQTVTKPTTYSIYSAVTTANTSADHFASDRNIANRFFWGDVAEILIFNTALSDTDRGLIEDYLANKYNIP